MLELVRAEYPAHRILAATGDPWLPVLSDESAKLLTENGGIRRVLSPKTRLKKLRRSAILFLSFLSHVGLSE